MQQKPVHRGIVGIDIERFSRKEWTDPIRARLRSRLSRLVNQALAQAEIALSLTDRNDTGDGLLLLVDAQVPTMRLLRPFATALASGLADDNRQVASAEHMRLRVVVHFGTVLLDEQGFSSGDIIHATRLLDAQAGRAILDAVAATNLVQLVSEHIYQSVVRHDYPGVDHRAYQPVWVQYKETRTRAWAHLPDQPTQPDLSELARVPVTPDELAAMRAGPLALATALHDQSAGPLIGHKQERSRLAHFVASIPAGPGGLLIEGAAGIGKTRLLAELWRLAEQARVHTVAVACPDPELRIGLAPWRALLAVLWPEVLADPAHEVITAGDVLVALFGDEPAGRRPSQPGDAGRDAELVTPVVEIVERAAATRPLLLVFEDAQHLDDRSLTLLRAVSARLTGRPVGFVAAVRHTDLDPTGPVASWCQEHLAAGRPTLEVAPLGRGDVPTWLSRIRKVKKPTAPAVQRAWERSGGNPLALRHVPLGPHDDWWDDESPAAEVPEVRHALLSTLKRRSDTCRDWLGAVAVTATDQRFDPMLVAHVAQLPQDLADQCQDEARRAAIVAGRTTGRLTHELWRAVILADLSTARVRALHAKAFHALRKQAEQARDTSAESALQLARHASAGRPHVQAADVAAAALAAAQAAARRFDYTLAIMLCNLGLEAAGQPQQRIELLIEHGDAWYCAGDLDKADRSYAQAGEVAAGHQKSDWQAVAALRSAYEWLVPFRRNPVVQQRLEAALEVLGPEGGDIYLQLQAQLAKILPSDVDRAEQQRRAALAHAALGKLSQITNPLVASVVLDGCRSALHDTESPATLLPLSQQLMKLVTRVGFEQFPGQAHMALIIDLVRLGRMHQARRELEEHREHATHTRRPLVAYSQLVADAMFALWDGRFDAAQRHIMGLFSEVPGSAQPLPLGAEGVTQQIATAQFGWLLRERGQADQLIKQEDAVQEMIRQTGNAPLWRAALALLYAETDNPKRAADIVAAIALESDDFAAFPPHGWAVPTLYLIAEVCDTMASAEVPAAKPLVASHLPRRLRGLLKPHLDEVALAGWPTVLVGPVARAAGLAALVCRDFTAAITLFKRAEQRIGGSPPTQARLHVDMARALLSHGDRADRKQVSDRLQLAVGAAEELGMSRLAAHAHVLLAAL